MVVLDEGRTPYREREAALVNRSTLRGTHRRLAPALLGALLPALVLHGRSREPRLRTVPAELAGLQLHHELSGARALGAIQQLHRGATIKLADAWIAQYGDGPSAILYVGVAASRRDADSLVVQMRRWIALGGTPFRGIHDIRESGRDVFVMSGQGHLHFLFLDGTSVVWLSADPAVACPALAEALGLAVEDARCDPADSPLPS